VAGPEPHSERKHPPHTPTPTRARACARVTYIRVCVSPRPISTGQLHTLQCFHTRPINPIISRRPYPTPVGRSPHLEAGFPLRCLQRLSFPNVANQPCPWQDNWHTRGSSVPVLSY